MKKKSKGPQRLVMTGIFAILLVGLGVVYATASDQGVAVGTPAVTNPSPDTETTLATNQYYTSPEFIRPASDFAGCKIVFFSASWDSFSLRVREMIKEDLASKPELCAVELDISEHQEVAGEFGVNMPPALVIFDNETFETHNNLTPQQASKLLSTL